MDVCVLKKNSGAEPHHFSEAGIEIVLHCGIDPDVEQGTGKDFGKYRDFKPWLWIRIDSILIWIQHYSSIRIRVRIRIHEVLDSGLNVDSDPDPDPQQTFSL
jgi:hypothetical protein